MLTELIFLGFLILLSGFFSGSETALFSLNNIKVHYLAERNVKGAKLLQKLKNNPHNLLTVLLISNNLVNIGASTIATVLAINIFGEIGPGIATGAMTLLVLIFGEITPKSIAITHNEKISLFVSKPIWVIGIGLFPLVFIFERLSRIITKIFGNTKNSKISHEELKTMITLGAEEGTIGVQEKSMIHGILKFDDKNVYKVMTPRNHVFSLEMNKKISEVIENIMTNGFSRIPVYDKRTTNIKGIVFIKDILKEMHDKKDPKLKDISRHPLFVPELKKIDELFNEFQNKKIHFAVVVDEHGGISGIITMEDLLEEIVGEIYDETDVEEKLIKKTNNNTYLISGKAELDEIIEKTGICLKGIKKKNFGTLNGLIQHKTGTIPKKGEKIEFKKFLIEVIDSDEKTVKIAKIIKKN